MVPQLLLVGDFFNTPTTLSGVEWTLRVEVLFYFFMFCMRYFKFIGQYQSMLPVVLIIATLTMSFIPAFPSSALPTVGYFNVYTPFLFLGVFFWLYENQHISLGLLCVFTSLIFIQYWHLVDTLTPGWQHCHFASLAFLLFLGAWGLRNRLTSNRIILFLSELTYSVYLLHNLLFDLIKKIPFASKLFNNNLSVLIILFTVSALTVKFIEKPGIKMGNYLRQYFKSDWKFNIWPLSNTRIIINK